MTRAHRATSRRTFLKATLSAGLGGLALPRTARAFGPGSASPMPRSRVALARGEDRANNVYAALRRIEAEVRRGLAGKKRVVVKPNLVSVERLLAADRVAVEVMGIDFAKIGYLNYRARARMGRADLEAIEILGPPVADCIRKYKLHRNVEAQYGWM